MNLGPIWAQRTRFAITERLLAIGAAATSTLLGMHKPIPADLGGQWVASSNLASPTLHSRPRHEGV